MSQVEQRLFAPFRDWDMVTGRVRDQERVGRGQKSGGDWQVGSLPRLLPVFRVSGRARSLDHSLRLGKSRRMWDWG